MSDHEDPPTDLMDAIFRLDDIAEWLKNAEYRDEAERLEQFSKDLKGYVRIRLSTRSEPERC